MKEKLDNSQEINRINALKSYQILDTPSDEEYDRITLLASIICEVPFSLLSIVDDKRAWYKSRLGFDQSETPREISFCHYVVLQNNLFEVADAANDERFLNNPLVTDYPNIRFYTGYPLIDPGGFTLGTLCVLGQTPKKLTQQQLSALGLLAREVISKIVQHRKKEEIPYFEKLFTLSNDLICVAGTDGFFQKVNPAFHTMLGWDEKTLLNKSFFELVHPDDLDSTRAEINKLGEGRSTTNFRHRFLTKRGKYLTLQWTATPEISTGNLYAIARNVTHEANAEDKIKASENKFRSFFEYSQGLMCTHDLAGKFLTVNKSGAQLLGYTQEELAKKSLFDIVPEKHHNSLHVYLSEMKEKGISKGLMTTLHKDGSPRVWLYNNTIESDLEGNLYVIGNSIDVTDRMRLEEDLKKTKEILEETNRLARVGAWDVNLVKNSIYWSDITKEIHEVATDFLPDMETAINFYKEGENRKRITEALEEAMKNGTSWDLELQIITGSGKEKWVRALGKAIMEKGVCTRLYGAFHDIDESKRIKLALMESENKYHAFFDNSPVGVAINRHRDGKFIEGNQALFNMIGYTEAEYRQLSHWDVTPAKYDDEEIKHRNSLTQMGRYGPYEKEYIHKDGHSVPVLLNGVKFLGNNGEEQVYSVIQNISDRKMAEKALLVQQAKLASFVEYVPAAVAMLDNAYKYVAVSNRWLEAYNLQGRDLIGTSHFDVYPDINQEWRDIYAQSMNGKVEKMEEKKWRPSGSDQDQYLRWETRPWFHLDGTIGGIIIMTQDITENCIQREELTKSKIQADKANLAKSEFLASMSHEIRTPLNGVIGFTDLILKTELNETQQQYLTIVNQSANALLSIINDILDFSKIEAGRLELEIEKCDLYEIGSQAADIISYQIKNKKLEMLLNISMQLPRFIWTDSVRLKQVLVNLLSNAAKFTDSGEIELKIEPLTDPTQKQITLRFEVRDTGIGIRKDKQKQIFQAFTQEDGTVTRKYGGTGLGLTISNKLLALMGSKLQLISSPGKGSRFFFDVTLDCEKGEQHIWNNLSQYKEVLVVDDNENNCFILSQMLRLENINATIVHNGIEALQTLSTPKKFDLILMDYNMPIMDGLEAIAKIRKNYYATTAEMPIMLLSSSSDDESIVMRCRELDVSMRLVKPIKMQDLYRSMSRLAKTSEKHNSEMAIEKIKLNQDNIRVLLAEDGEVNRLLAKIIIKKIAPNAEIIEVNNGQLALEECMIKMPDIIFMDIQMPVMNGYEATQKIREMPADTHVPIIAITAGNVMGEREKCIAAGMDDFIAKPIVELTVSTVFDKWIYYIENAATAKVENSSPFEKPPIDIPYLKAFLDNNDEILRDFLLLIKTELQNVQNVLKQNREKKDLKILQETGHKLKGTCLSGKMETLSVIALKLEEIKDSHSVETEQLLSAAIIESEKIEAAIEPWVKDPV